MKGEESVSSSVVPRARSVTVPLPATGADVTMPVRALLMVLGDRTFLFIGCQSVPTLPGQHVKMSRITQAG